MNKVDFHCSLVNPKYCLFLPLYVLLGLAHTLYLYLCVCVSVSSSVSVSSCSSHKVCSLVSNLGWFVFLSFFLSLSLSLYLLCVPLTAFKVCFSFFLSLFFFLFATHNRPWRVSIAYMIVLVFTIVWSQPIIKRYEM